MPYIDRDRLMELSQDVLTFDYETKSFGCFSGVSDEDITKIPTADVVEKSLFTELESLIEKAEFKSDSRDAEYGAKYATEQIAYLVSEFIRIKVNGGKNGNV